MNLGIGLGGLAGGLIASVAQPSSFTVLFLVDAATFLAYVGVLAFDPRSRASPRTERRRTRRRTARSLRDRVVRRALGAQLPLRRRRLLAVQPRAAVRARPGAPERAADRRRSSSSTPRVIVIAQLPISRAIEGRRRMRALALMPALWIVAWLLRRRRRATGSTATAAFVVIDGRARDLRRRRVLPRPGAPGARRRDRPRPPARALLRRALALVGPRRHRRAGGRRLHARVGAVRALAARCRACASSPRSARSHSSGACRSGIRRIPHAEVEPPVLDVATVG